MGCISERRNQACINQAPAHQTWTSSSPLQQMGRTAERYRIPGRPIRRFLDSNSVARFVLCVFLLLRRSVGTTSRRRWSLVLLDTTHVYISLRSRKKLAICREMLSSGMDYRLDRDGVVHHPDYVDSIRVASESECASKVQLDTATEIFIQLKSYSVHHHTHSYLTM